MLDSLGMRLISVNEHFRYIKSIVLVIHLVYKGLTTYLPLLSLSKITFKKKVVIAYINYIPIIIFIQSILRLIKPLIGALL